MKDWLIKAGALRQYLSNTGEGPYIAAYDLEVTNRLLAHLEVEKDAREARNQQDAAIIEILRAQVKRMEEQQNAHRSDFLLNGARFKLNFSSRGNVDVFHNYAAELQGRWVALVPAEDDMHLSYAASRFRAQGGITCNDAEVVAEVNVLDGCTFTKFLKKLPDGKHHLYARAQSQPLDAEKVNDMRIALTIQIDELIDVCERYERAVNAAGDDEEQAYVQGAIDYARKVAAPYKYNGPYRAGAADNSKESKQ